MKATKATKATKAQSGVSTQSRCMKRKLFISHELHFQGGKL